MATLGERIRALRNEKKLTLVQLAGNKMTKGMLSLIENNKATPSMENLTYIAEQLNVPMAELLGDHIAKEENLLEQIKQLIDEDKPFDTFADDIWKLYKPEQPFSEQLSGARLAVYFGKSAYYVDQSIAPFFTHAEKVYKNLHAADLWVDTIIDRVKLFANDRQYNEAIQFFALKKDELDSLAVKPTPMRMLKWYFYLAAIQFGLGSYSEGMETIEKSMKLSKEHHIYYMMNQLLRMGTAVEMMTHHEDYEQKYLQKLKQYMIFSEDEDLQVYIPFIEAHFNTTYHIDLQRAKNLLNQIDDQKVTDIYFPFLDLERGKLLYYENKYDEARHYFNKSANQDLLAHPFDQSVLASRYTYLVKIAQKTDDSKLLSEAISLGKKLYDKLPNSFYKEQFKETIND